ncbi:MAG: hypothetical protein ABIJ33_00230 [Patescibacteria group bacterium]
MMNKFKSALVNFDHNSQRFSFSISQVSTKVPFLKLLLTIVVGSAFLLNTAFSNPVRADIINPAVGTLGGCQPGDGECVENPVAIDQVKSGATFLLQFVKLWRNTINLGAIMVLLYFIWGAVEWISSGGDKNKLESARNKMLHAVLGLIILVSSFVIIGFISGGLFAKNFDILNLQFFTPGEGS